MMYILVALILSLLSIVSGSPVMDTPAKFNGHMLWSVKVSNAEQLHVLEKLESDHDVDFWTDLRYGDVDFRVDPRSASSLKTILALNGMNPSVMIEDLQALIDEEQVQMTAVNGHELENEGVLTVQSDSQETVSTFSTTTSSFIKDKTDIAKFFKKYRNLDEYNALLRTLETSFPDLVSVFSIGESYEGRPIYGATIHSPNITEEAPELFFNGAHHAREWIGPAVTTYIGSHLVLGYGKDEQITTLLNTFVVTFLPVLNVDGFIYSHTSNRMWRKNRQPTFAWCVGTDLNRNWDMEWRGGGSSSSPCSEAYRGSGPFSAPETQHISSFIKSRKNLVSYIDFHAYSQLWMFPYGYSCSQDPKNLDQLFRVATPAAEATKAIHGTEFEVGPICRVIYQASGNSVDWSYEHANVTFPMAIELRDKGRRGFLLPPEQIIPSGEEMLVGVITLLQGIKKELDL